MNGPDGDPSRRGPAIAIFFFLAALALYGRHLDFPASYHPDESKKVTQVVQGCYNFHHPMLMLTTARATALVCGRTGDFAFVTVAGRWITVMFAAASVGLLALLTARLHGTLCGAAAGFFLLFNPALFELAHYFKEDPALLFGISLSLVALAAYERSPLGTDAFLLGLANAVAGSGKYVGFLLLPFTLWALWKISRHRPRDLLLWAGGLLLGLVLLNLPALLSPGAVAASFSKEMMGVTGQSGITTRSIPHGVYTNVYWSTSTPVLVLLLIVYAFGIWQRRFRMSATEWVLVLFPVVFFLILSCSPKTHHRYFLPCAALFACLSAAGLQPLRNLRGGSWLCAALIAASTAWQVPGLVSAEQGFTHDHRRELIAFLDAGIPPESVLLEDYKVDLPPGVTRRVIRRTIVSADTLESLRAEGVTHVVVTSRQYGSLFLKSARPRPGQEEDFNRRKQFYERLFREARLLREWETGSNLYLGAPLRLYDIQSPK